MRSRPAEDVERVGALARAVELAEIDERRQQFGREDAVQRLDRVNIADELESCCIFGVGGD